MLKVVIADDQPLMRDGLKYIIEQDSDIEVVGCAANGTEALALCEKFRPDVVLMDIGMPESDGIEGTRLIKSQFGDIRVIILTTFNDRENIVKAIELGAEGYMMKDIDAERLIVTIKGIAKGLRVLHEDAFHGYISGIREAMEDKPEKQSYNLTAREIDIIRMIVLGNSNKEISSKLGFSEAVVRNTISGILARLELQDRTQLAVFSIRNRIV